MRVYLRTFGCRANQYDTEIVREMVTAGGAEVVDTPEAADVAVFNSCAVTAEAIVDLRKNIRRAVRQNSGLRSVVMGCAAALDHGELAGLPSVERVIAGADYPAVAESLQLPVGLLATRAQAGTRGLLRIQDGCDEHCTFCATTVARGANRSRAEDALVDEARQLADRHPEIVLTGIHIGTYGRDRGSSLGALVQRLIREVPVVRYRLTSIEATEVDARLAELFQEPDRLAPHLHAPLQSGANRVLRRMGRHWYTAASYARAVEAIARISPVFAIGADVIAGFPGESDEEHRETLQLVQSLPFTYLHVFPFSIRPGTPAERLADHVHGSTIAQRARDLRELAAAKEAAYRTSRAGGEADVVVVRGAEGEGLTEDYLTVMMPSVGLPRGSRVRATLSMSERQLVASPLAAVCA
ncbi:MAG: MiaB/RimO family radical SAM methylthiotransferase [Gemmatimonadaceae bacterium]